ncbi:hypothetical protein ACED98_04640 [Streptococcus thoraltensis]
MEIRLGNADADRTVFIKPSQDGLNLISKEYKAEKFETHKIS